MKMIRVLFCIIICWSAVLTSVAAQISVTATLDSTRMLIGDQMNIKLEVSYPVGGTISHMDLKVLEEAEKVEIITTQANWDTLTIAGKTTLKKNIVFTIFESGSFFIPAIPIDIQQNGRTSVLSTNELLVNVVDVVPVEADEVAIDTVGIAPIKPIYQESMTFEDVAPLLLAFLLIGIIGGLIYFLYRRAQNKKLPPKKKVIVIEPAHVIALRKLETLKAEGLWQKGAIKEYQSQLTFIVREYLENRYGISALESTTYEILGDLKPIQLSEDWKQKLREMLELADLVKFAKAEPAEEAHDRLMGYAEEFVKKTKRDNTLESESYQELSVENIGVANSQTNTRLATRNKQVGIAEISPFRSEGLQLQYADFGIRFLAYIIDLILSTLIFLIIYNIFLHFFSALHDAFVFSALIFTAKFFPEAEMFNVFFSVYFLPFFFYVLIACFYFGFMESIKGYTIGKKIVGIRVADYEGNNINLLSGIIRIMVKIFSSILIFIPFITFFFSIKKQTFYDMAAKSIIIKKEKTP